MKFRIVQILTAVIVIVLILTIQLRRHQSSAPVTPQIISDWWDIGPEPDLTTLGLQPEPDGVQPNQPNDHHIFQSPDGAWYCYYCGHHNRDRTCGAIYVRTSQDLIDWSDWKIAQYDKTSEGKKWLPESPHVVFRQSYYYLFRTHGERDGTYVFRSADPLNFGQGDVSDYFVTRLDVIAPEIIVDESGTEYITKIHNPEDGYGIKMARMIWE